MQKYTKRTSCPKLLEPSNPRTLEPTKAPTQCKKVQSIVI